MLPQLWPLLQPGLEAVWPGSLQVLETLGGLWRYLRKVNAPAIITAAATTVLAIYAYQSHEDAMNQIGENRKQFAIGNRPYVGVEVDTFEARGLQIGTHIVIKNFGKSPALGVRLGGTIMPYRDVVPETLDDIKMNETHPIFPGDPGDKSDPQTNFPGQSVEYFMTHSGSLAVVGRVTYTDATGAPYRTDFCYTRLLDGVASICPSHNDST